MLLLLLPTVLPIPIRDRSSSCKMDVIDAGD